MKVYIRRGNIGDIPWMLKEFADFQEFFGSKKSLFEKEAATQGMTRLFENGLVLVAERDGQQQLGFIIGAITPHLFNPKVIVLAELLWWVEKNSRKTRAGFLLLKEFVAWGKKNVDWITFALEERSPVNEETLTRFGFRRTERSYLIEVGCGNGSINDNSSNSGNDSNSGRKRRTIPPSQES